MEQRSHLAAWDLLRMRHGVTLRLIEQIPAEQLTRHPIAGMRTPVELIVHMYATLEAFPEGVLTGTVEGVDEAPLVSVITTRAALLEYVNKAWAAGDRRARQITDAQLGSMVATPWGKQYPGAAILGFVHDEYQHHRGQLYAYVRTYGVEPVMVWDFEHNAAEFQPRQAVAS